jgi:hypothetical protein
MVMQLHMLSTSAHWEGRSAVLSDERPIPLYRYRLDRWQVDQKGQRIDGPLVLFCGLNPSKADALLDDRTVVRWEGFAEREGCTRLAAVNVSPWRETASKKLRKLSPEQLRGGPEGDHHILNAVAEASLVIACWGDGVLGVITNGRISDVCNMLGAANAAGVARAIHCLGKNPSGTPKHPLFLAKDTPLEPYVYQR